MTLASMLRRVRNCRRYYYYQEFQDPGAILDIWRHPADIAVKARMEHAPLSLLNK